jgi:hypothetical protein
VPGADLDNNGICSFCRGYNPNVEQIQETRRNQYERDLEKTLNTTRGVRGYDAVVCLSGGKDSIYLLYRAVKECGLRVLAFTIDANIPDVAWASIRKTIDGPAGRPSGLPPAGDLLSQALPLLVAEPGVARRGLHDFVRLCAAFRGRCPDDCAQKEIPLVLAGYSPGQPEKERMEYEFSRKLICETDWTPPGLREAGVFSEAELTRFWNPGRYPPATQFPRYIAPFHAWRYNQGEIMQKIVELGLVPHKSNADPVLSNYPVNWLLMYSDLKNFGLQPVRPGVLRADSQWQGRPRRLGDQGAAGRLHHQKASGGMGQAAPGPNRHRTDGMARAHARRPDHQQTAGLV